MIADEALVPRYDLPDPLVFADGARVRAPHEWAARRREIINLFAAHVYGVTPELEVESDALIVEADATALDGAATRRQTRLILHPRSTEAPVGRSGSAVSRPSTDGSAITIDLLAYGPAHPAATVPVILVPNFRGNHAISCDPAIQISERARRELPNGASERGAMAHRFPVESIVARGFQVVTFYYGDVIPDADDLGGGTHAFFTAGSAGRLLHEWGAIGAWAWGMSRILDHLLADPRVDRDRVILAGHSRLGKTALWAAAQDERFAAVFANNSGCTGAAISRRRFGETVAAINAQFPHWFCRNYHTYAEREHLLPVDQHELIAMMAPRPVYVASAAEDLWADPRGEYLGAAHASTVYRLLGYEGLTLPNWPPPSNASSVGRIGYHVRPGGHDLLAADWARFLDFVQTERRI